MPYADLTDVRCRYEITGAGDPLLMIVGLGSTCEKWGKITGELARHFTLIQADNRDMGQSVARRRPVSLSDYAVDFVELLDHLQLDKAHVMGLSLGGIIAQRMAIDHSSRIDRLVLVSCTNRFGPYLHEVARLLEQALRRFPAESFQRTMEVLGTSPEFFDAHAAEIASAVESAACSDDHRARISRQLWCLGCQDVAPRNEYCIKSPTLVIAGERDMLIPPVYARRMASEIPGSEFIAIPACGHDPLDEKPAVVIPRIVEFLSRPGINGKHNGTYKEARTGQMMYDLMEAMEE